MKGSGDLERRHTLPHLRTWLLTHRQQLKQTAVGDLAFDRLRYEIKCLEAAIRRAEASEAA